MSVLHAQLDEILARQYPDADVSFVTKVVALVEELYKDADAVDTERIVRKLEWAFGVDAMAAASKPTVSLTTPKPRETSFVSLVGDGWFSWYLDWTKEHEAPTQFHFGSALACVAAGFGRAPRLDWAARETFPNMYVLLVGPSGGRKGAAVDIATELVNPVFDTHTLPREGTPQGFARQLQGRVEATGSSTGFIVAPEYSVLLRKDKNKEGFVQWLTDWYDCPPVWERGLSGEGIVGLANVCVTMLGASNIAWLHSMPSDAVSGGFLPRQLVFHATGPRHRNWNPQFNEAMRAQLTRHLVDVQLRGIPEVMKFDTSAERYLATWYEEDLARQYAKTPDENFRYYLDRKQAHIMKVAVVWQLLDRGPRDVLCVEWVHKARKVVDWCDPGTRLVYGALGTSAEAEVTTSVAQWLERQGGRASQRAMVRALRNQFRARSVRDALDTLYASGEVRRSTSATEGVVWEVVGLK